MKPFVIDMIEKETRRHRVTAEWLFNNPDEYGYIYNEDAFCDPWTSISGVDFLKSTGQYVLEYGTTGEKIVDPNFMVWVQSPCRDDQ